MSLSALTYLYSLPSPLIPPFFSQNYLHLPNTVLGPEDKHWN